MGRYQGHAYRTLKGMRMIRAGKTDEEIIMFFEQFANFSRDITMGQIRSLRRFERAGVRFNN